MNQALSNRAVLHQVNETIQLRAPRASNALLNRVFRSIFLVPKALEYSEPDIFQLDQPPDQIMWRRMDPFRMTHLPLAMVTGMVPTAKYQVEREYDFIVVVDVSQSMMLDWWPLYGGSVLQQGQRLPPGSEVAGERTKLFVTKYALAAFARAAISRKFNSVVVFAGGEGVRTLMPPQNSGIDWYLLGQIDDHYRALVNRGTIEAPRLADALTQVTRHRRRCVVLCISDFADTRQHIDEKAPRSSMSSIIEPLAEIAAKHRLLVLQVNDEREIRPELTDFLHLETKNCAYLNGEASVKNAARAVDLKELAVFARSGQQWYRTLAEELFAAGLHFGRVVIGVDDQEVERCICELGQSADEGN